MSLKGSEWREIQALSNTVKYPSSNPHHLQPLSLPLVPGLHKGHFYGRREVSWEEEEFFSIKTNNIEAERTGFLEIL